LVCLAASESISASPIAKAFPCFMSTITAMFSFLKLPSTRTIPGAITVAPLQTYGIAPISTTILGALVENSEKSRVGNTFSAALNKMGFPEIRYISPTSDSTISIIFLESKATSKSNFKVFAAFSIICFASFVLSRYRRCFVGIFILSMWGLGLVL